MGEKDVWCFDFAGGEWCRFESVSRSELHCELRLPQQRYSLTLVLSRVAQSSLEAGYVSCALDQRQA